MVHRGKVWENGKLSTHYANGTRNASTVTNSANQFIISPRLARIKLHLGALKKNIETHTEIERTNGTMFSVLLHYKLCKPLISGNRPERATRMFWCLLCIANEMQPSQQTRCTQIILHTLALLGLPNLSAVLATEPTWTTKKMVRFDMDSRLTWNGLCWLGASEL